MAYLQGKSKAAEVHCLVVVLSKVFNTSRLFNRLVFPCHMVGYKVDDYFHASLVGTVNKFLELLHSTVHVLSQVGINIVIVCNGVW